jgi:hypothetical protein
MAAYGFIIEPGTEREEHVQGGTERAAQVVAALEPDQSDWCISGGYAENSAYRCRNIPEPGEILCYYCLESHAFDVEVADLRRVVSRVRVFAEALEAEAGRARHKAKVTADDLADMSWTAESMAKADAARRILDILDDTDG